MLVFALCAESESSLGVEYFYIASNLSSHLAQLNRVCAIRIVKEYSNKGPLGGSLNRLSDGVSILVQVVISWS